jgi:hypothetical protein
MTEAVADSGDKICRPGGEFARGSRGETQRRGRAFIGRSRGGIWCLNLLGINSGKYSLAAEVTAALMAGGGRRLTGGSHESVRGREKEGYRFGFAGKWAVGRF